eukprot:5051518-Pyramimonas_sp.AAC.2
MGNMCAKSSEEIANQKQSQGDSCPFSLVRMIGQISYHFECFTQKRKLGVASILGSQTRRIGLAHLTLTDAYVSLGAVMGLAAAGGSQVLSGGDDKYAP